MSRLTDAAERFAEVWDRGVAADVATQLTCTEVEALVDLFRSEDRIDLAEEWISAHALGDDPGDRHYIGREA